jgi:FKBP-type peptidyl-prolyl cis-trans isomerase
MRKNFLLLIIILWVFPSCNFNNNPCPYKGYKSFNNLIYYRYADLGVKTEHISPGKIMEFSINYSRMNNSIFWDSHYLGYPFTILLSYNSLLKSSGYQEMLLKCNEGDSINFILKKDMLFAGKATSSLLCSDSMVRVNVRILSILDSNQLKIKMKKTIMSEKDKELEEYNELTHYLAANNIPDSDKKGDIYLVPLICGSGPEITNGCRVIISYRGYFINHTIFDSTPVNEPLDFVIGDSGQVLNGMEKGIKKMREGEKAKIIIPSHSAFGEKGSSTGIIPPYATLVYEVTILKVNRP